MARRAWAGVGSAAGGGGGGGDRGGRRSGGGSGRGGREQAAGQPAGTPEAARHQIDCQPCPLHLHVISLVALLCQGGLFEGLDRAAVDEPHAFLLVCAVVSRKSPALWRKFHLGPRVLVNLAKRRVVWEVVRGVY